MTSLAFASRLATTTPRNSVTQRISGRATRSRAVYTLSSGKVRRIIQVGQVAYGRVGRGRWQRTRTSDPTALQSLRAALAAATGPRRLSAGHISVELSPAAATRVRLLTGVRPTLPITLELSLDGRGRVVSLATRFTVRVSGSDVVVALSDTYSSFDHTAPIRAPQN